MGLQTALYQQHTLVVQSGCAPCMSDFQPSTKASRRHVTYLCTSPQFGPVKKFSITKIRAVIASLYINATYTLKALQLDYLFDFFMTVDRTSEPADSQEE